MGLIRLSTGQLVDVLKLDKEQIRVWDFAWAMSMITRNGGHLPVQWSVLDHTTLVFILAMMDTKGNVNPLERLAILLHDSAEAYVGDLLGPSRDEPPFDGVRKLELHILDVILSRWGLDKAAINWEFVDKYDKQAFYVESMWMTPDLKGGPGMPKEQYPMEKFPPIKKVNVADYVQQLRDLSIQLAEVNKGKPDRINELFELPEHLKTYAYPPEVPVEPTRFADAKSDDSVLNMRLS